jgi:LacI family sucrose operon transcriptional repressor
MKPKNDNTEIEHLVLAINPAVGYDLSEQAEALESLESYLTAAVGVSVKIALRENYEETLLGMERGEIDAARLGRYAYALAQSRFGAKALVNAIDISAPDESPPAPYRSVIFTRADSGISSLMELKGSTIGFVDPSSTTGYLVPIFMLEQAGLDPTTDIKPRFLHGHKAVVAAVNRGEVLAGSVMQGEFTHQPDIALSIPFKSLAVSPLLSRGPIAIRPGLNYQLERKLLAALVQLHQANVAGATLLIPANQRFTPANQREMTLKTVAELAGVSYGTVSRAINGRGRIAPGTTARILRLVEELGYRPNANARSLHKTRGDLVGLLLPSLSYPGLDKIISGIQAVLSEARLQLVVCPVPENNAASRKAYFELLYNNRLEGLLLTQRSAASTEVLELSSSGRPTALLEQELLADGLKFAWNWLCEQGFKRVALVLGENSILEPTITRHIFSQLAGAEAQILEEGNISNNISPDAFLCTDDQSAIKLRWHYIKESKSPLVLGFDNSTLAQWTGIPSLAYDAEALGQVAAQRLLKILGVSVQTQKLPLNFWVAKNTTIPL